MSRSLSASSSTRTSKLFTQLARSRPSAFLRNMSSRRPGVATMMFPLWKESSHLPVRSGSQKHGWQLLLSPHPANHLNPWENGSCRVGTARAGRDKDKTPGQGSGKVRKFHPTGHGGHPCCKHAAGTQPHLYSYYRLSLAPHGSHNSG